MARLELEDAARGDRAYQVFRSWVDAARHLCDHVLTAPEAPWWLLVLEPEPEVDLANPRARFALAKRAWQPKQEGAALQDLYDRCCEAVERSLQGELWVWDGRNRRKYLGPRGLAVVTDEERSVVVSAYLPAQGSPLGTVQQQELEWGLDEDQVAAQRAHNPLPRQVPDEAGEGDPRAEDEGLRDWQRHRLFVSGVEWFARESLHTELSELGAEQSRRAHEEVSALGADFVKWQEFDHASRGGA